MILESIEITNIRSIEHMTLDMTLPPEQGQGVRKWTLLLGENGTGKSTALKASGLVLAGSDSLPFVLGEPTAWIRNGQSEGSIRAVLQNAEHEQREVWLEFHKGMRRSDFVKHNISGLDALDAALSHTQRSYFTVGYGALRRLGGSEIGSPREGNEPHRARSLSTLFDNDAILNPLQAWAMGLEYRTGETGTKIIQQAMAGLLPETEFVGIDRKLGDLIFETPDGEVPLSRLSDGYQNVTAWIGDLLYRITEAFDDYDDPLSTRGLLLIDEIDAHLHPKWQRNLREFIDDKLPQFQIIGTTHSVLTAQQMEQDECLILTRDEKGVHSREFPGAPADLRAHELLAIGFGVESLDSMRLQKQKETYRRIKRGELKAEDSGVRLDELEERFDKLPERDLTFGNEVLAESHATQAAELESLLKQIKDFKSGSES